MELNIRPTNVGYESKVFRELLACSTPAQDVFELLVDWLGEERSVTFMRSDFTTEHVIGISFEQERDGIAVGVLASEAALQLVPNITFVPKDAQDSDLDSFVESRNERLGIEYDEQRGFFIAPKEAVEELLFSYALAEKGFSQVQLVQRGEGRYLELLLVILTASGEPDWGENLFIDLESDSTVQ